MHNLALRNDGTLWAWGRNLEDQIGDNSNANQTLPVQIGTDNSWSMVAVGTYHSLALKSDGTLWGWGGNVNGESGGADIPALFGTDSDWAYIAAGLNFSGGIKSNGTLWMWGSNLYGKLGNGTTISSAIPVQVGASHDWISVALGNQHAIALKSDGTLWGWGLSNSGELGIIDYNGQSTPIQIGTATDWAKIIVGYSNSYALKNDGTLWSWGGNDFGSVGNGQTADQITPVQIGTSTWKEISAVYHVLAIRSDGTLWSWGRNLYGELGNNNPGVNQFTPIQIGTGNDWIHCAAGFYHSLALKDNGTLWSWGDNQHGALGKGNFVNTATPSQTGTSCNIPNCSIPNITLPNINAQCGASIADISVPVTTDSCGNQITASLYIGDFPITMQGVTVIQWKFTNTSGHIIVPQNIEVVDIEAPVPQLTALPIVMAQCQVTADMIIAPSAMDTCSGAITGTTAVIFPVTGQGTTTITWTYADGNGNTATQTQQIIIEDTQLPVPAVTSLPAIIVQCEVTPEMISAPSAIDDCVGTVFGITDAVFPLNQQGASEITWIYSDGNGNMVNQIQEIIIDDTVPPQIALHDVTLDLAGMDSITITPDQLDNGSTDNCDFTLNVDTSVFYEPGIYAVTVTSQDTGDNIASASATVTVIDSTLVADSHDFASVKFYPSPVKDYLYVIFSDNVRISDIHIYDNLGRVVYHNSDNQTILNLAYLSSGTYYIVYSGESWLYRKAIVKL